MAYLIPLSIIVLSIAGLSYILIRKIKTLAHAGISYPSKNIIKEISSEEDVRGYDIISKIFASIGEGDTVFVFMEKFFRKMRVRLMKVENFLTNLADSLHKKNIERKLGHDKNALDANKAKESSTKKVSISRMGMGNDSSFDEQYWLGVLKHDPESAYPYRRLGEIYLAREDFSNARFMMQHALRLEPDDSELKQKIEELRGKRTKGK